MTRLLDSSERVDYAIRKNDGLEPGDKWTGYEAFQHIRDGTLRAMQEKERDEANARWAHECATPVPPKPKPAGPRDPLTPISDALIDSLERQRADAYPKRACDWDQSEEWQDCQECHRMFQSETLRKLCALCEGPPPPEDALLAEIDRWMAHDMDMGTHIILQRARDRIAADAKTINGHITQHQLDAESFASYDAGLAAAEARAQGLEAALREIAGKWHQHEMDPFYMTACTVCIAKAALARPEPEGK